MKGRIYMFEYHGLYKSLTSMDGLGDGMAFMSLIIV